jgi:hypothetical protein
MFQHSELAEQCSRWTEHRVARSAVSIWSQQRGERPHMFFDKLDPMALTKVRQWADSPLAKPSVEVAH